MFASMRRYQLHAGSIDELTRRVDEGFAEEISAHPGFVSYELVDSGEGELMTISVFGEAAAAEASRGHARRWNDEKLKGFEFTTSEPMRGEILVSRAAEKMLAPGHVRTRRKFASVRRYALRHGAVDEMMHVVDEIFADRIQALEGFAAYHVLDCGRGEIVSISVLRDQATAEESDDLALAFVRDQLGSFDIERTEVIGGEVVVSRAMAKVLEPAHA
jgi:quinol monooxygenase YgiN